VGEVAHQEEVVQTLQRALETANVRAEHSTSSPCGMPLALHTCGMPPASEPAFLFHKLAALVYSSAPRLLIQQRLCSPATNTFEKLAWRAAAAPALLWTARHRKDVDCAGDRATALRARTCCIL